MGVESLMQENTFIVVDNDYRSRNELTMALGKIGYVVPADSLDDLGGRWPEEAWVLVHDHGLQLTRAMRDLRQAGRFYPLVAYSKKASISHIMDVLSGGAAGYFEWPTPDDRLQRSLANILARKWQNSTTTIEQARAKQKIGQLSPREREVLTGVCEGFSSKEVARTLGISPRTVELHRANVLNKLGVRNVAAAVRLSVEARFDGTKLPDEQRELAL
ncbi:LuxR C-terminal-related transcriptional regulator [Erythrobacter sp. SN021]|uniref:HTH luxR-type domain-containing protein n=2 Tax=Erythrobacter aureus TaxID=2182384 RepID=A0A345YG33_9SPHN|nr:LuxR C-terminal-related transcriptional regulator [Erythrobacter sp. SN021]AXK42885.1 hypothetical protein DVR09_11585 [Erythrobacter aureus]MCF8881668.1 LuxR C-terminal-related transcriptional regulator [Erythrobacter sp. SN021]